VERKRGDHKKRRERIPPPVKEGGGVLWVPCVNRAKPNNRKGRGQKQKKISVKELSATKRNTDKREQWGYLKGREGRSLEKEGILEKRTKKLGSWEKHRLWVFHEDGDLTDSGSVEKGFTADGRNEPQITDMGRRKGLKRKKVSRIFQG